MKQLLIGVVVLFGLVTLGAQASPDGPAPDGAVMSDGRPVNIGEVCIPDAITGIVGDACETMRRDSINYQTGFVIGDIIDEAWMTFDGISIPTGDGGGSEAPAEPAADVAGGSQ